MLAQAPRHGPPAIAQRRQELEIEGGRPIPAEWEAALAACLAKDARDRPQSARGGLGTAFEDSADDAPVIPAAKPPALPSDEKPAAAPVSGRALSDEARAQAAVKPAPAPVPAAAGPPAPPAPVPAKTGNRDPRPKRRKAWLLVAAVPFHRAHDLSRRAGAGESAPRRGTSPAGPGGIERQQLEEEQHAQAAEADRLAHARGGVIVRSNPPGAIVRVAGRVAEKSPATVGDLPVGPTEIQVELDGYTPQTLNFPVVADKFSEVPLVELVRQTGTAVITTDPAGAAVELSGPGGFTANDVAPLHATDLPTGDYAARVTLLGFHNATKTVHVTEGPDTLLQVMLEPIPSPSRTLGSRCSRSRPAAFLGSPDSEAGRDSDEGPQTTVEIQRPFWLGKTEITHGQWKALMGENRDLRGEVRRGMEDDTAYELNGKTQTIREFWDMARDGDPSDMIGPSGDNIPMHYISWDEAMEFAAIS